MSRLFILFLAVLFSALPTLPSIAQEENYPIPKDAQPQEGVPQGKIEGPFDFESSIYPGTQRQYWIYVPAQYDPKTPTCSLIVQDGLRRAEGWRLPQICDNLIHAGEIPAMIGIFINPGEVPTANADAQPRFNRSFEYDSLGDRYARFLLEEILPEVSKSYNLSENPNDRALAGASSGGICAFNAAWERPDAFRRVISTIGTFVGLRGGNQLAALVRKYEAKPLRVFLQDGSSDLNIYAGDWWSANQDMLSALTWAGYDVNHVWGEGGHNGKHGAAIMPDAMRWLWRDYPQPIEAAPNKQQERRVELLIDGAEWEEVSTGHEAVEALTANAGGQVFFSDASARRVYRIGEDKKVRIFADQMADIRSLSFCPDGQLLAIQGNVLVQFGTDGKMRPFLPEYKAACLATLPGGFFFSDPSSNVVRFANYQGKILDELRAGRVIRGMAPTVDHCFLHLVGDSQFTQHVFIGSQELEHAQEYGHLEMPYGKPVSGATAVVVDQLGRYYVASSAGIQVLDQLGRVNFILAAPSKQPITDIVFGGGALEYIYVSTATTVYRRRLNVKGTLSFAQPSAPPRPGL